MYIGPRLPESPFSEWDLVEPRGYGTLAYDGFEPDHDYYDKANVMRRNIWRRDRADDLAGRRFIEGLVVAKRCSACGGLRAFFDFHRKPGTRDGRLGRCKDCENRRVRRRYRRRQQGLKIPTRQTPCRKPEAA